jgi:hypothetical protein
MSGMMMAAIANNVARRRTGPAPGIISNGLTLYLDAADTNSYSGSGTTWNDLSSGNTGTIVNSPAYTSGVGGYFNFGPTLNTSKRVSFTYQTPIQTTSTAFTWNIWVYPEVLDQGHVLMGYRGTTLLQFYKLTTTKFEMYPAEIYHNFNATAWQYISAVYDGTQAGTDNMKMYVNGTQVGLRDADQPDLRVTAMPFFVGGDPDAGEYSRARISKVSVYNRALSSAEIIQNYNVHRADFGL